MVHGGIVEVHTSWLRRNSSKKEPKKKIVLWFLIQITKDAIAVYYLLLQYAQLGIV